MFLINFFFKSLSQKTENFLNQITKTETNQNTEKHKTFFYKVFK